MLAKAALEVTTKLVEVKNVMMRNQIILKSDTLQDIILVWIGKEEMLEETVKLVEEPEVIAKLGEEPEVTAKLVEELEVIVKLEVVVDETMVD